MLLCFWFLLLLQYKYQIATPVKATTAGTVTAGTIADALDDLLFWEADDQEPYLASW